MLGGVGESVLFSNKQTNKQKEEEGNKKRGGGGFGLGASLTLTPECILILKQMSKK